MQDRKAYQRPQAELGRLAETHPLMGETAAVGLYAKVPTVGGHPACDAELGPAGAGQRGQGSGSAPPGRRRGRWPPGRHPGRARPDRRPAPWSWATPAARLAPTGTGRGLAQTAVPVPQAGFGLFRAGPAHVPPSLWLGCVVHRRSRASGENRGGTYAQDASGIPPRQPAIPAGCDVRAQPAES